MRTTEPMLTENQMRLLLYIAKFEPVSNRQAADYTGLSVSQIAALIETLMGRHQIERFKVAETGQYWCYRLTPELRAAVHGGNLLESGENLMLSEGAPDA